MCQTIVQGHLKHELSLDCLQESGNDVSKKVKEDQSGSTKSDKKFTPPIHDEEEHANVKWVVVVAVVVAVVDGVVLAFNVDDVFA